MNTSKRDVVVTGVGVVTSNGTDIEAFQNAVIRGEMGIKRCPILEEFAYSTVYGGWIDDGVGDRWEDRFIRIARCALDEAMKDADLKKEAVDALNQRSGFYMGSANLGSLKLEKQLRERWERGELSEEPLDFNTSDAIFELNRRSGVRGASCEVDAACASSTIALGEAFRSIRQDEADLCIVGGADVFSDLSLTGFDAMNNLDETPCKPFDRNHSGITIGEGAAFVVLEERKRAVERGAKIYGRIFGYHTSNDAFHVTAPDPKGEGAYYCMDRVLREWEDRDKILFINTHGTATQANDGMEIKAMEKIQESYDFEKIYFSSTKSMIGHTLGASGLIEFIASVLALEKEKMPLSISVDHPVDYDENKLELVTENSRYPHYRAFISNSFAFAGNSASIGYEIVGD